MLIAATDSQISQYSGDKVDTVEVENFDSLITWTDNLKPLMLCNLETPLADCCQSQANLTQFNLPPPSCLESKSTCPLNLQTGLAQ